MIMIMLFFVGILEMVIVSVWTKTVSESKVAASGFITLINIFIWYFVLQTVMENINNWVVVMSYACGCAIGTMICTYFYRMKENRLNAASNS
jgi:uncharacterized protein YebE (UPF0316 family)